MTQRNTWHALKGTVHHNNDHCRAGLRLGLDTAAGTGGKPLCSECKDLARRGVPRIMKDWDKTEDGRIHSILLPTNAKWPLSQYQK